MNLALKEKKLVIESIYFVFKGLFKMPCKNAHNFSVK